MGVPRRQRIRLRRAALSCGMAVLVAINLFAALKFFTGSSISTDAAYGLMRHAWHADHAASGPLPLTPQLLRMLTKVAAASPVTVVSMTGHFLGAGFLRHYETCPALGQPELNIQCHWAPHTTADVEGYDNADTADVLAYHAPSFGGRNVERRRPEQLTATYSMESAAYFPNQASRQWLSQFDITMLTDLNSTFPLPYLDEVVVDRWRNASMVPTAQKVDAVAFVNSNCADPSGRTDKVRAIMDLGLVRVDAYGACLQNQNLTGRLPSKKKVFRRYKFCIAMENSVVEDYVTEKIYHALMAGCLPIYLGSSNIATFLPDPNAALQFENAQQISEEMLRLMKDNAEYDRRVLSWRNKSLAELPEGLRRIVAMRKPNPECKVCQRVVQERVRLATEENSGPPSGLHVAQT